MSKVLKKYSSEFKDRAVRLLIEKGMKANQVSLELDVPTSYLSHWKKDYLLAHRGIKACILTRSPYLIQQKI